MEGVIRHGYATESNSASSVRCCARDSSDSLMDQLWGLKKVLIIWFHKRLAAF